MHRLLLLMASQAQNLLGPDDIGSLQHAIRIEEADHGSRMINSIAHLADFVVLGNRESQAASRQIAANNRDPVFQIRLPKVQCFHLPLKTLSSFTAVGGTHEAINV